jgi:hypothetical protein
VGGIPKFKPSFELPMGIDATVTAMTEIFLSDTLLHQWVHCTNRYAAAHLPPGRRKEVLLPEILWFLATIQYMGIVRLPAKQDYFPGNRSDVLPAHHAILLNKTRFEYLWRWFHTSYSSGGADETTGVTEEEEEFFEEAPGEGGVDMMEFADVVTDVDDDDDDEEEDKDKEEAPPPTWYASIQGFIDHVNNVNHKLCRQPCWKVSIDEMLRKFKGRSAQTYRTKRKPDREVCCTTTGFVFSYFPDGRLEGSNIKIIDRVEALIKLYLDRIIFSICLPWTTSSHNRLL